MAFLFTQVEGGLVILQLVALLTAGAHPDGSITEVLGEATLLLATIDVGRRPFTIALLVVIRFLGYRRADLVSNFSC